jgi:hypothetical protein
MKLYRKQYHTRDKISVKKWFSRCLYTLRMNSGDSIIKTVKQRVSGGCRNNSASDRFRDAHIGTKSA